MTCILNILVCLSVSGFSVLRSNPRLCACEASTPPLSCILSPLVCFELILYYSCSVLRTLLTWSVSTISLPSSCFIFYFWEMSCIAQIGVQLEDKLELLTFLPAPPEYLNYRRMPPPGLYELLLHHPYFQLAITFRSFSRLGFFLLFLFWCWGYRPGPLVYKAGTLLLSHTCSPGQ